MNEPAGSPPQAQWTGAALLALVAVLPYLGVLRGEFVAGDLEFIVDNIKLHEPSFWRDAFVHSYWYQGGATDQAPYYRPLIVLLDGLNWAWFGRDTLGYHLTNLFLHALTCISVWRLLRLLMPQAFALWAACLFAVHPIQVHAVAYISGRTSVLCTLLVVSSTASALHADTALQPRARLLWLSTSLLLFAAALLAKEHAVVAPLLSLCALYARSHELWPALRRRAGRLSLELLLVAGYLVLRKLVLGQLGGTLPTLWDRLGPWSALLSIAKIVAFYPWKLLWPSGLSYLPPFVPVLDASAVLGWCWLLGAVAALVALIALRTRYRVECALAAWLLIALAPVSGLAPLEYFVKEHHAYLAAVGFCGLLARFAQQLFEHAPLRPSLQLMAAATVVLSLLPFSLLHAEHFRDTRALYERIVELEPEISDAELAHAAMSGAALRFAIAHLNLGLLELEAKRYPPAHAQFTRAYQLTRSASLRYQAEYLAGESLLRAGEVMQAERAFQVLSEREPKRPEAEVKLADIASARGARDQLKLHLQTACTRGSTTACERANHLAPGD